MTKAIITQRAYIATRFLDIPIWAIYNMLPFILLKDLNATPFQLALVIALKPMVSVLSMYWSSQVNGRPDRLRSNIIIARILGCSAFFLFPYIRDVWLMIFSSALYMTLAIGVVPAWMEILKKNLPDSARKQTFAWGSAIGYLGGGLLPLLFAWKLDINPQAWQWIFPIAACISLLATFLQLWIPIDHVPINTIPLKKRNLVTPWQQAWKLLRDRPDFANYQFAFMVIGGGLMLMQPALYLYFDETLGLSYVEFAVAISFCKGISYAAASPIWAKWMSRVDIFRFSSAVTTLACFFPLLVMSATLNLTWLYVAYILYGTMQAGSELSWNMSGPIFSKDQDSSIYTAVNVVTVGLRGMIFPALGGLLCTMTSSTVVMVLGCLSMLLATALLSSYSLKHAETSP
jgi:Major Facilitator Superfamily